MPPQPLPAEYGFLDTVWICGNYVNKVAAMPSLHFGYAFPIGRTLFYPSTVFERNDAPEKNEFKKSIFCQAFYMILGLGCPALIFGYDHRDCEPCFLDGETCGGELLL